MKEQIIKIWDQSLNYKYYPSENSKWNILILHWWWWKSDSWNEVGNILSRNNYDVYIPDLPGFWKSPLEKTYTIWLYAQLIENFIRNLDLDVTLLLWHSNGWAISTQIIANTNHNIGKLILNNSAWVRLNWRRRIKRLILKPIAFTFKIFSFLPFYSVVRRKIYSFIGSADYVNTEKENPHKKTTYLNMIWSDMSHEFKMIKTPTLLLWGEKDTATPLSDASFMRANIKDSEIVTIVGQGHSIHLKSPIKLCKHILEYLA